MAYHTATPALANGHPIRRMMLTRRAAPKVRLAPHAREEDGLKLFVLSFTAFFICIYTLIM